MLAVLLLALAAQPTPYRTLQLALDVPSRRLNIGSLSDELPRPVLSATITAGGVRLYPDLWSSRLPERWSIGLEILDAAGNVVDRPMPIIGSGIPPLVVEAPPPPRGRFLRASLEIKDSVERARSRPVILPASAAIQFAPKPASATIVIDTKERALPLDAGGQAAISFDLDVPATVRLRIDDGLGAWWDVRRVVTADRVARPQERAAVSVSLYGGELRLGSRRVSIPEPRPWIASTWIDGGVLSVGLIGAKQIAAWRLMLFDPSGALVGEAAGEESMPDVARIRISAEFKTGAVLRLEAQHKYGHRVIGPPLELPPLVEPDDWAIAVPPERAALDRVALVVRLRQGPLGGAPLKPDQRIDPRLRIVEVGEAPGPVIVLPLYAPER